MSGPCKLFLVAIVAITGKVEGQEATWWDQAWNFRQKLEITTPDPRNRINTAFAKIDTQGHCSPGGADVRVIDDSGQPVAHAVSSERSGVVELEFEVNAPRRYSIYYGNKEAPPANEKWERRLGGLTLESRPFKGKRPPQNFAEMETLVRLSPERFGTSRWEWINDRANPFGPNDRYISIYKGLIFCPEDGVYRFATNSDDASFLLIDGQLVAEWPSGHEESIDWEYQGAISLSRGIHAIEYYHVEVEGGQLARAGWKLPSQKYFSTIPKLAYIERLHTRVVSVERRDGRLCCFFEFDELAGFHFNNDPRRFVNVAFRDCSSSRFGEVKLREWNFGDGDKGSGAHVTHEFRQAGKYPVDLRAMDSLGFVDVCKREVQVRGNDAKRVGLFFGVDIQRNILRRVEPLELPLRFMSTSERPLTFSLRTSVEDKAGQLLEEGTEQFVLEEGKWFALQKSFPARQGRIRIAFALMYAGVDVLERSVSVLPAGELSWSPAVRQSTFVDARQNPVVLRTIELEQPDRHGTLAQKMRRRKAIKILVVDDSLAPARGEESYCDILQNALKKKAGGNVEVKRVQMTTAIAEFPPLVRLAALPEMLLKEQPDVVVVTCSIVDVLNYVPLDLYERYLMAILDLVVKATDAELFFVTCPPLVIRGELSYRYALMTKRVGMQKGVRVVDLYSTFRTSGNWERLFRDYESREDPVFFLYPNADGQSIIAREMARTMLGG